MKKSVNKWIVWPILANGLMCLCLTMPALAKKKLTLAEIAALEWKLEQSTMTLTSELKVSAREKALAEIASIKDPRVTQPLALALKEDPAAQVRLKAAGILAKLKTPEAKGLLLIASSSDPDEKIRKQALSWLNSFPKKMTSATLPLKPRPFKAPKKKINEKTVKDLLAHPSGDARLFAVKKLSNLNLKDRLYLLNRHALKDPSARVRIEALRQLYRLDKTNSLKTLIQAVEDGNPRVRFEAAQLIATFKDPGALAVMQKLAKGDANQEVRNAAKELLEPDTKVGKLLLSQRISVLGSPKPEERIRALQDLSSFTHWRAMVPMACTLLSDKEVKVRAAALESLSNVHDSSVLTALRVAAMLEKNKRLRNQIRTHLVGMRKQVDQLIRQLKSKDPHQRATAARFIGQAAYPPGLDSLIAALKDPSAKVRLAAVRGLTNYASQKAAQALQTASADADTKIKKAVASYFKRLKVRKSYRQFFKDTNRVVMKTTDPSPVWRIDAAVALGIAGADRAVGNLSQLLLHDKDENVRLTAAWALVLMASDRGEAALKKAAAKDPSERVRLTARKYLVINKVPTDDLLLQLDDENAVVRRDAAEALSLRPKKEVLSSMVRSALCDPEPEVRMASMRGLSRIASPLARTALHVALSRDPSSRVRRIAYMMYILAGGE